MFKRLRRWSRQRKQHFGTASAPGSGLQVCAACHADYVHPVEWHEAGDEHWWMLLRCGECRAEREVTVPDDVATRYNADLDSSMRAIDREVRRLDRERMAGETEIFVAALHHDLIDAGDFVGWSAR
jgi:hypothetical protein